MLFTLPGLREKADVPGEATDHRNAPTFLEIVNKENMGQYVCGKTGGGGWRLHVSAPVAGSRSRNQMRRHDADELARCDHLGALPELREMPLVAGYQIVGTGRTSTFQEFIIVRGLSPPAAGGKQSRNASGC